MGMLDSVRRRIQSVFRREQHNIQQATELSIGAQPVGFDTASIYGRYGIEPLVDYLRIEQELVSRYMDYNEMCVYPELNAALECYADESSQFDILTGRTVWVESDDAYIKKVLQELIDDRLQLDEDIWGLSFELNKYGNCFSELLCTGEGVIGLNAIPPETIRRYEKGKGLLVGYAQDPRGVFGVTVDDVEKALRGQDPTASGMAYFEPWQILHMRLMGLQRQAPYGHCVTGDTKVWCNPAVKEIKSVKESDRVYMRHSGKLRSSEVVGQVSNGRRVVYKLKTTHREIRATDNHQFLVYHGEKNNRWTELKDIQVGDKIMIATTMPGIGRPPTLGIRYDKLTDDSKVRLTRRGIRAIQWFRRSQKYGQNDDGLSAVARELGISRSQMGGFITGSETVTFKQLRQVFEKVGLEIFDGAYQIYRGERTTKLKLPDFVTPWFCRLWGFLLGDGWTSQNRVSFARGIYPKLNKYYTELLKKLGLEVRTTNNNQQSYADSQDLVFLLKDLGWKDGAHEKTVPNWIYGLPEKYREEFLAGFMDADGWESDSDGTHAFHTELCNRELVRGIKTIIDGLGYKCGNIRERKGRSNSFINGKRVCSGNTFCITFYKSKLEQPFDYDVVKSKEYDGVEEVYDIGVEDPEHNFIADGIVAHNSTLESARWLWRRLLLLEDSALLYRLTRSPQKWLFYIDVGKLPPNQALGYLRRIKNEFTKNKFVNERGCLTGDTCVETLSGKIKTMKELADEGKDTWIYSYDTKKNKVVPALARAPRKTASNVEVWRVVLDNGAVVRCTPDHRFLLRDGTWSEAKDLKRGSSMMPFHLMRGSKGTYGYARIKHIGRGQWQFVHQMVAEELFDANYKEKGLVVHHRDSKSNNDPRFLELLDPRTHTLVHSDNLLPRRVMGWKHKVREDANFRFELGQRMIRNNRKWMKSTQGARKQLMEVLESKVRSNPDWSLQDYADWMNASEDMTRVFKSLRSSTKKISKETIFQWIKSCGYSGVQDFKNDCKRKPKKHKKLAKVENHKVVESCFDGYADVYDLTVDGTENFALTAGIFAHNSLDMRYSPLASDENIFVPVVDGKRTTEVELMSVPEWQVMDDINYFRDKLFTAIRIPKAYLAAEEVSRARTLSLEDVRFARSVMRIQRELKNGIKRICKIHLAAMNVDPEKVNFDVFMTVPSWAYEMAQLEVRSARADFAEKIGDKLSERAVLRLVFGYSDEEINALRKERQEEMREAEAAEGGGGGEEKKAPAKTEGSIMDLPRLSRVLPKDEEKEDKNMRVLKEKMDEMLGQNKEIAESLDQSKEFMKNMKTSIMFQPYRGNRRIIKSMGGGPRRNA